MSPLGIRIFSVAALTIVAVLGVCVAIVGQIGGRAAATSVRRALSATQATIQDKLDARSGALRATAAALAGVPTYVAGVERALAAGDRGTLLDLAQELKTQLGAQWALLTDAGGTLVAWSDHPERYGNDLAGGALIALGLQGSAAEGIWLEPTERGDAIFQAVAVPLRPAQSAAPIGVLVAAIAVDSVLAQGLKKNTDSEIVFFTRDTLGAPVTAAATIPAADELVAAIGTDTTARHVSMGRGGATWVGIAGSLRSAAGLPLAGFVGLRSQQAELAPFRELRRTMVGALLAGLILALAAAAWLANRIARPVRALVGVTRRVEAGDYTATAGITAQDEIGELGQAIDHMVAELREKQRLLDFVRPDANTGSNTRSHEPHTGATLTPFPVGSTVANRYRVDEQLGAGGMGVVYRAHDLELGEDVALKCLHPNLPLDDPSMLERFKQEIRLARRITHRNVVRTHDLGEDGGRYFITMEFVEGKTLDHLIKRRGKLPIDVTLTVAKQVLRALEAAHEEGVIHRDIKPANVVVDGSGFVKVMDFGVARLARQSTEVPALTQAGSVVGSPDYMAPEQILGDVIDHRVDLYATGCVMYEALTGRRVFESSNIYGLISQHLDHSAVDVTTLAPDIPKPVAALLTRALAKDKNLRWASATTMLAALEAL